MYHRAVWTRSQANQQLIHLRMHPTVKNEAYSVRPVLCFGPDVHLQPRYVVETPYRIINAYYFKVVELIRWPSKWSDCLPAS